MLNIFKTVLTLSAISFFSSAAMADRRIGDGRDGSIGEADRLDILSYCSNTCDLHCYNIANQARSILMGFEQSCGRQPRLGARLTADGRTSLVVRPGQQVFFQWNSINAVSANSTYQAVGSSNCATGPAAWVANTTSGSTYGHIEQRQVGCTYYITFRAYDQQGNNADANIQVQVVP